MPFDSAESSSYSEYELAVLVYVFRGSPIVQDEEATEKMAKAVERMGFLRI